MAVKKIVTTIYKDDESQQEYQFEPIDNTIELKQVKGGFELRYLTQDSNPEPPDNWDDTHCFLVHYHRDFWVENKIITKDVLQAWYHKQYHEGRYHTNDMEEPDKTKDYFVFAISAYIHSGVSLSLDDGFRGRLAQGHYQFDVSHVGAVLVKKKEFGAGGVEFELSRDDAHGRAAGLVKTWNQYLSGDVYCIVCEKLDKDKQSIEFDIVGGYFGLDYAKEALKTEI